MTRTISIRLNQKLAAKVDKLAATAGRPADWLIRRMIEDYIDGEIRIVTEIREALEDEEGELIDHEVVMAEMDQLLRQKLGDEIIIYSVDADTQTLRIRNVRHGAHYLPEEP